MRGGCCWHGECSSSARWEGWSRGLSGEGWMEACKGGVEAGSVQGGSVEAGRYVSDGKEGRPALIVSLSAR